MKNGYGLLLVLSISANALLNACPMAFRNESNVTIYVSSHYAQRLSEEQLDLLCNVEHKEDEAYHQKMATNFGESFVEAKALKVVPNNYKVAGFPSDSDRFPSHSGHPFYVYAPIGFPDRSYGSNRNRNGKQYGLYLSITQKSCFMPGKENDRHKILTFTAERKLSLTKPSNFIIEPENRVVSLVDAPAVQ